MTSTPRKRSEARFDDSGLRLCDVRSCKEEHGLGLCTDGYLCKRHTSIFLNISMLEEVKNLELGNDKDCQRLNERIMNKIREIALFPDRYLEKDSEGHSLCQAVSCKETFRLRRFADDFFCPKHHKKIIRIRKIIKPHRGDKLEIKARMKELKLRKYSDQNHIWMIAVLIQRKDKAKKEQRQQKKRIRPPPGFGVD